MTPHSLLVIEVSARTIIVAVVVIILVKVRLVVILIDYCSLSIIVTSGRPIITRVGTRKSFWGLRFRCWLLPLLFAHSVTKRVS